MKTKAPSSMKRLAAARPMPVAPPVITAVFPLSLSMSCILGFTVSGLWLNGEVSESLDMGSPKAGDQCGFAHIGGAKTIQYSRMACPNRLRREAGGAGM